MRAYLSYLRIFATFGVVVIHVAALFVVKFHDIPLPLWKAAHALDTSVRFAVPVFLMISGALLLDKDESLVFFLQKRFRRILIPFLFWSIIYFLYERWFSLRDYTFTESIVDFYFAMMKGVSFHFWYVYLILGIYLFIPILRRFTQNATQLELLYFIVLWAITLFITPNWKKCFPGVELSYFGGYIGYPVLGLYLSRVKIKNSSALRILALMIILASGIFTYTETLRGTLSNGDLDTEFYGYLSPNVAVMAFGIFIFFRTIPFHTYSISIMIDRLTYGIYLVHILVLEAIQRLLPCVWFPKNPFFFLLFLLFISCCVFVFSFIVIAVGARIPYLKKIIT